MKVSVVAGKIFPSDYRMVVQRQVLDDESEAWVDDGLATELAPGGRASANISGTERFYVSASHPTEFYGELRFGQGDQMRIAKEGWNGQEWYDHQVVTSPDSPYPLLGMAENLFRYRVEPV